ncbi:MAG: HPr kinase/phosphorylase [Candidatus Kapabacteria bacterium]|nr:HPr kinase/phosphorylase [Ignavibacteriota bacterium]MCW5884388.1 HPr kinase/phosphorylase [Candidatus Kapabacteria bacterium]
MSLLSNLKPMKQDKIPVGILLQSPIKLKLLTNEQIHDKEIIEKNLHRPQLALAGYVGLFTWQRIQIFGNTEINYLQSLKNFERIAAIEKLTQFNLPCVIITNNNDLDKSLIEIFEEAEIPVFQTEYDTTKASYLLSEFLDDQFSPQVVVHGSFVDVYGVGMLFVGRSGIGKSEVALDLIERGHRLVADDVVMLTKKREAVLMGTGTSLVQHFMEIRGLGIIDIRQMFGIRSIRFQKRLEIVVELEDWDNEASYTRTGLDELPLDVMGVEISKVKLPIFPGKNITVISEVIAINYLLRTYGYDASQVFSEKLNERIKMKSGMKKFFEEKRIISYFQGDNE